MLGTQQVLHRRGENAFAHLYARTVVKRNDKSDSKKDGMFTESETLDLPLIVLKRKSDLHFLIPRKFERLTIRSPASFGRFSISYNLKNLKAGF